MTIFSPHSNGAPVRIVPVLAALLFLTGCPYANPHTRVGFNVWTQCVEFDDTKDNDIEIDGLKVTPDTKQVTLDKLVIRNNASEVRRANVEQIKAQTEQVQAITAMITQQTQILAGMAQSIMPFLRPATSTSLSLPGGGGITHSTTPTTQPSNP